MTVVNPIEVEKVGLMDRLEKCSACGSGICLAISTKQGRPNWCNTLRRIREEEARCPTCKTNVPASAIQQQGKKSLR